MKNKGAVQMVTPPWIVQSRHTWCVAKDQSREPNGHASSVETLCGHFIALPWGVRRGLPDCIDCRRVIGAPAGVRHCPSCVCGRRARVQADHRHKKGPGSIVWTEHEEAWSAYASMYGSGQSAQLIHERGGFGYGELVSLLGREPMTWAPVGATMERER